MGPNSTVDMHAQELNIPAQSSAAAQASTLVLCAWRARQEALAVHSRGSFACSSNNSRYFDEHGCGKHVFSAIGDRSAGFKRRKSDGTNGAGLYSLVGKGDVYDGNWFAGVGMV